MGELGDRIRAAGEKLNDSEATLLPAWLRTAGTGAWLFVGIAAALAIVGWFLAVTSGISVPLILAVVVGMAAYPLCERLMRLGFGKSAAAITVVLALVLAAVLVITITFTGLASQWPSIRAQAARAIDRIAPSLGDARTSAEGVADSIRTTPDTIVRLDISGDPFTSGLLGAVAPALRNSVAALFSFAFRVLIGLLLLYYVLADFPVMAEWVAGHMGGLPRSVSEGIVDDAVRSMRAYFRANTISGAVVAAIIGFTMFVLGVPLALPVAIVTFMTIYIPFFGAIISGAFAFVVALATKDVSTAVLVLVAVLVAQNIVQSLINYRLLGQELGIHPLVVLVATMIGGIFGGLLGAALGAPVAALGVSAAQRLRDAVQGDALTVDASRTAQAADGGS